MQEEAVFNDKDNKDEEDFVETAGAYVWTANPLFSNNSIDERDFTDLGKGTSFINSNLDENSPRKNAEYETESGYSETVSFYSELSSPDFSYTSNTSYSDADEEVELIAEITEAMLKTGLLSTTSANDSAAAGASLNPAQIVSSKGTVRGVKNRVRDSILHFCSTKAETIRHDAEVKVKLWLINFLFHLHIHVS